MLSKGWAALSVQRRSQNLNPCQRLKGTTQRTARPYLSNDVTVLSVHLGCGADVPDHAQHLVNLGAREQTSQQEHTCREGHTPYPHRKENFAEKREKRSTKQYKM